MSLKNSLKQPFPYDPSFKGKLRMAAFFGIFIFSFLLLFKPFELYQYNAYYLFWLSFTYGIITLACVLTGTVITPLLWPESFNEKVWTTGRQILFTGAIVFIVGLVNFLVSPVLVDTSLSFRDAVWFQGITLAIGLLPVSLFILLRQNQLLKKYRGEAAIIEEKLQERIGYVDSNSETTSKPSNKISFESDYQNEKLEVSVDELHLITSASNYIKLFHLKKDRLAYSILRCTLKKVEEETSRYGNFFKCHRAFVINLDKVIHVEGNAQGYKVRIEGYDDPIPVSRNLSTEFSDKLLALRSEQA